MKSYSTVVEIRRDYMYQALGLFLKHKQFDVETGQMSAAETGQMSAAETGHLFFFKRRDLSCLNRRHLAALGASWRGPKRCQPLLIHLKCAKWSTPDGEAGAPEMQPRATGRSPVHTRPGPGLREFMNKLPQINKDKTTDTWVGAERHHFQAFSLNDRNQS